MKRSTVLQPIFCRKVILIKGLDMLRFPLKLSQSFAMSAKLKITSNDLNVGRNLPTEHER